MKEPGDKKMRFLELHELLMLQLESGELPAGERIPSERILADKSGISYMTARQAVQIIARQFDRVIHLRMAETLLKPLSFYGA